MRFRPLALFALAAGFAVLAGDFGAVDAQTAQQKQDKKAKRLELLKKKAGEARAAEARAAEAAKAAKPAPAPVVPVKPVTPPPGAMTKDAAGLATLIDAEITKKLAAAKLTPSPRSTDEEFLRRAALDLAGVIPTAERARAFLDSTDPNKREKLIDELLADPNFGRRMADIWTPKLFPTDSANRFVLKEPLYKWLEGRFNANTPWDRFVAGLVTATGSVEENPATTYFLANRSVDKLTDTTAQHFLGLQLQCAQCHNHPFTTWKQTEYWGMAAFYSKVKADNPKNANKGGDNTKIGVTEGNGRTRQKDFFPESAKAVSAKFLGGAEPPLSAAEPYRPALAKWLTAPENPFFARALVNRTWAHLFGRGLVNPIDDMLPEVDPSHPELLDALTRHMATAGGFDLKYLLKALALTDAYQRTSKPTPANKADKDHYSHLAMKVMTPEQLFDSLAQVTGLGKGREAKGPKVAGVAPKGGPVGARAQFVNFFLAGADSTSPVDYEAGIPQALRLMNSPIANNPAALRMVLGSITDTAAAVEQIYLTALSRRPTADERKMLIEYVSKAGNKNTALGDILWAVLNSSEFTLVR